MSEILKKEIESLRYNRIWVTKKARMEAEARMNRNNIFTQLLVNYYTFVVLAFSIWTLVSQDSGMSLLTVIASVGLFGVSIFVSSIGYREKALQFKESYLSLNQLEFELKDLLRSTATDNDTLSAELRKFERQYSEILTKSENHIDIDYIKVQLKHDKKLTSGEFIKYYIHNIIYYFFSSILILAPVILSFVYIGGI
ncbi:SLATT domain-containing protein [Oceanobacillus profundus]|uniref:SLATT domain-containing protein n=1 Tax=Oceanobacillus profundus TaxID=372463 RepID=UPI00364190C5